MVRAKGIRPWIWAALFAALTAVGAQIRIPMVPVPVTFQTFFVYLAGGFLGARWGAVSQIFYLLLGLVGLPVFAGESGLMVLFSPTIGYLLSFPLAAFLCGKWVLKEKSVAFVAAVYFLGSLVILLVGVLGIFVIQNLYLKIPFSAPELFFSGMIIFLPGELLKVFLAAVATQRLSRHWRHFFKTPLNPF